MKTAIAAAFLVLLAVAGAAQAQAPTAGQTLQSSPPPPVYTLALTAQDIAYIGTVLRRQPYQEVAALLEAMQAQISAQRVDAPKAEAAK